MKKTQILGSEKPKCELGSICHPLTWATLHNRWAWYCFVDEDKYQHELKVKKCIGPWKTKSQELNTHPPNKATDHPSLSPLLCGATWSLNLSSLCTSLCRAIFLGAAWNLLFLGAQLRLLQTSSWLWGPFPIHWGVGVWWSPTLDPWSLSAHSAGLWESTFWRVVIFTRDLRWSDCHYIGSHWGQKISSVGVVLTQKWWEPK